jgi:hypothetical protein
VGVCPAAEFDQGVGTGHIRTSWQRDPHQQRRDKSLTDQDSCRGDSLFADFETGDAACFAAADSRFLLTKLLLVPLD